MPSEEVIEEEIQLMEKAKRLSEDKIGLEPTYRSSCSSEYHMEQISQMTLVQSQ